MSESSRTSSLTSPRSWFSNIASTLASAASQTLNNNNNSNSANNNNNNNNNENPAPIMTTASMLETLGQDPGVEDDNTGDREESGSESENESDHQDPLSANDSKSATAVDLVEQENADGASTGGVGNLGDSLLSPSESHHTNVQSTDGDQQAAETAGESTFPKEAIVASTSIESGPAVPPNERVQTRRRAHARLEPVEPDLPLQKFTLFESQNVGGMCVCC